ncbi:unnamed protein product [Ixodes persulcatus]
MKLVLFSHLTFFLAMHVDANAGEKRIDEEKTYWENQDIRKASLNFRLHGSVSRFIDRTSWLYYRTYSRSTDNSKHICVYSTVKEKKPEDPFYEFEQGYTLEGNTNARVTETLYATPYKTESDPPGRNTENAMTVTKTKGSKTGLKYQLIYSNYDSCDILRVLNQNGEHDCELHIHDKAVDGEVPRYCETMYENACGKDHSSYKQKVYDPSCKKKN